MRSVSVKRRVALEPAAALALWTDVNRWTTFVEGFASALRLDRAWPRPGAEVEWESIPAGRGRVTEIVEEHDAAARFATRVYEGQLAGVQRIAFAAGEDGATVAQLTLEYELQRFQGAVGSITDRLFIRRA